MSGECCENPPIISVSSGIEDDVNMPAAAPSIPPTDAPETRCVCVGSISDVILMTPPVTITIHTAPTRTKMIMCCISIFALDADYLKAGTPRCFFWFLGIWTDQMTVFWFFLVFRNLDW